MVTTEEPTGGSRRVLILALVALVGTVVVVLSGDVVQATASGAGCGESWPRCDGALLPGFEDSSTAIEFAHRMLTFVLSAMMVALLLAVRSRTPPGHHLRRVALWAGVFFALEVVIGAMLVVFGWVEDDASVGRVVADALHVANTFFLVGALALVVFYAAGGRPLPPGLPLRGDGLTLSGAMLLIAIAVTGAVNSLADTLFPAGSVLETVRDELGGVAPFLLQIRAVHPIVAISGGLALYGLVRAVAGRYADQDPTVRIVYLLIGAQFVVGFLNIALLTPLEVQVIHLLLAQALWISFLFFAFRIAGAADPRASASIEGVGNLS